MSRVKGLLLTKFLKPLIVVVAGVVWGYSLNGLHRKLAADVRVMAPEMEISVVSDGPLDRNPSDITQQIASSDLEPMQVLQQYVEWHSIETLQRESAIAHTPSHRRFAVGYYSCPLQAGNRLHHFFNSFLWAVVTNRTLLWKYYDKKACKTFGQKYDPRVCWTANRVEDCDMVLKRAPWIPSFEEWKTQLLHQEPVELSFWATHPHMLANVTWAGQQQRMNHTFTDFHYVGGRKHPWHPEEEHSLGVDADHEKETIIFPIMLSKYNDLQNPEYRNHLLTTEDARERARKLYSEGPDFLYGMLFRHAFTIRPDILGKGVSDNALLKRPQEQHDRHQEVQGIAFNITERYLPTNVYSVALHSRHHQPKNEGHNVRREMSCLKRVLRNRSPGSECHVYLMSDRLPTLERLQQWLKKKANCTGLVARHDTGHGLRSEHGPFAGLGFFQDLALVTKARDAFIGSARRSSSDLIRELIEYDRRIEALLHQRGQDPAGLLQRDPIEACFL